MTADWRETLERVAELLAEMRESTAMRALDWMRADDAWKSVRGLLAEPQPGARGGMRHWLIGGFDPSERQPTVITDPTLAARWARRGEEVLGPFVLGSGLTEPQVNPSEAKDREIADLRKALKEIKYVAAIEAPPVSDEVPGKVWNIAFNALARPGLLAEGEESREP